MTDWPVEVIGFDVGSSSIAFDPFIPGFDDIKICPFVEIDPEYVFECVEDAFGERIKHVCPVDISLERGLGERDLCSISRVNDLPLMPKEIFLNDIQFGGYLQVAVVKVRFILLFLGSDESWIIFHPDTVGIRSGRIAELLVMSKRNANVIPNGDAFNPFFEE